MSQNATNCIDKSPFLLRSFPSSSGVSSAFFITKISQIPSVTAMRALCNCCVSHSEGEQEAGFIMHIFSKAYRLVILHRLLNKS